MFKLFTNRKKGSRSYIRRNRSYSKDRMTSSLRSKLRSFWTQMVNLTIAEELGHIRRIVGNLPHGFNFGLSGPRVKN